MEPSSVELADAERQIWSTREPHPEVCIGHPAPDNSTVALRMRNKGRHYFSGLHRHAPGVDQVYLVAATVSR
jgi:hypothetical protein